MTSRGALVLPLLSLALGACGGPFAAAPVPVTTPIRLDAATVPETAQVIVPMPLAPEPRLPVRAERASLWEPGTDGVFRDRRARAVGDILTIEIEIDDEARLSKDAARRRSGDASIGAPRIMGLERVLEAIAGGEADLVDIGGSASAEGGGTIDRAESVSLTVAATVVQVLGNGNLVIAGRQEVAVDGELRELRVAGVIRPRDVRPDNSIPYERIAEARITYGGRGQLSRQVRSGPAEGVLDAVSPL